MPSSTYHVETRRVVTTRTETSRGGSNGPEVYTTVTREEYVTPGGTSKKEEKKVKKKNCCSCLCCGIPFGRRRKNLLDEDATVYTPEKGNKKQDSGVTVISKKPAPSPSQTKKPSPKQFRESALNLHNRYRQQHGVPKLVLSDNLNRIAQNWAEHLADTRTFGHSSNNKYGENIFFSQRSDRSVTAEDAVSSWYDEIQRYSYSRPNQSSGTGHFTQVVWKNSKQLGIGWVQMNDGTTYVVANYEPAGNVIGEYEKNVFPPK